MRHHLRHKLWRWTRSRIPEGSRLPLWAMAIRVALFPLDSFYWHMGRSKGFQLDRDIWLIDGITYSAGALRLLAESDGETYRVTRTGKTVWLERVKQNIEEPTR